MVTINYVNSQLKSLGITVKGWGSSEMQELVNILLPNERITGYSHGWYDNGFATLVATSERLLLIDKKLFHLTIEDVRYDMIAEVDFNAHLLDATIQVTCVNKTLRFTAFNQHRLRALTYYIQQRVMELRNNFSWQQFEQTPLPEYAVPIQPLAAAGPDLTQVHTYNSNPYTKTALTTKHKFLPRMPRRR